MATALNLGKKMMDFLRERVGQKFTAREVAEWIFETYPEACQAKRFP